MKILVIAEHDNQQLNIATRHTISAAQQLPGAIELLVAGSGCTAVVTTAQNLVGISKILHADHPAYQHWLAENMAALIQSLAADYSYILAPATTFGKNILPRLAALLNVEQISDVMQIVDAKTFIRPIYAGNALETVKNNDSKILLTIRGTAFLPCSTHDQTCSVEKISTICDLQLATYLGLESTLSGTLPDLNAARIVIAGGRGLHTKADVAMLEQLALKLHAALGASKAAVDTGLMPNDLQIGQAGKVVAPDLYIAIGISGAIQHLAGMQDSKVIVAINKDPDAPIFKIADYGLVADLYQVVPELIKLLATSI